MDQGTPKRSNAGIALLAALLIAGSAIGVMLWQLSQKEKPLAVKIGVDAVAPQPGSPEASTSPAAPPSGLDLLKAGDMAQSQGRGGPSGSAARPQAPQPVSQPQAAAATFSEAVRRSEAKAHALAIDYTRRYPAIAQYGRDWVKYSDLKKLNDDYMRDHDPVKFLSGLAQSENFPKLAAQYARDPAIHAFIRDVMKEAPGDVLSASTDLLAQDGVMRALLAQTAKTMGMPQSFADSIMGTAPAQDAQKPGPAQNGGR